MFCNDVVLAPAVIATLAPTSITEPVSALLVFFVGFGVDVSGDTDLTCLSVPYSFYFSARYVDGRAAVGIPGDPRPRDCRMSSGATTT
jgi:hypothetical protein